LENKSGSQDKQCLPRCFQNVGEQLAASQGLLTEEYAISGGTGITGYEEICAGVAIGFVRATEVGTL
jgi:hypothetical protein